MPRPADHPTTDHPTPDQSAADPAAFDFLAHRMSYSAKLLTAPVPNRQALGEILTAALRVPDHGKLEPWRLVVVERGAMTRIADLAEARAQEIGADPVMTDKARGQFDRSHLAVVVIASPKASDKAPRIEQVLSAGALCLGVVNATLAAGWGAAWISGWIAHDHTFAERAFGCGPEEFVAGIIHIGSKAGPIGDRPRPDLNRVVSWVSE